MSSSIIAPISSADSTAGSAAAVASAGPSSVEPMPPVEQLMEGIEEKCPPSLDQRLHAMDEVDLRIDDLLSVVAEVMAGLDKDKPLSKAKMEELYKKYELKLDEIQRGIVEQLTYMEQVCVGAEHQGSTYHYHQVAELSAARLHSLRAHLAMVRNNTDSSSREREEGDGQQQATRAADEERKNSEKKGEEERQLAEGMEK
ncbi:hypothetical protein niasHS_012664 [Heterodera schachtii]|uniref:Mediator of RNA polymerase II transcription subunit 11 n=1 Tax=Heterodera schachtii TaxID=97005 RepID=A0ABD2IY65_HETSC